MSIHHLHFDYRVRGTRWRGSESSLFVFISYFRLTSAFAFPEKSSVEVKATVLNINSGKNRKLMEKCRTLSDYSEFVRRVRVNMDAEDEMGTAIDKAVDSCIRDGGSCGFPGGA